MTVENAILAHFSINIFYETSALAWFSHRRFVKEFYTQSNIQAMRVAMEMPHPLTSRKKKLLLFRIAILQFPFIKTGTRVFSTQEKTDKNIPDKIQTLCKQGRSKEVLHALYTRNNPLDSATYASILLVCIKNKALSESCTRHGFVEEAPRLFQQMQGTIIKPDEFTFASILPACAKLGNLEPGMELPSRFFKSVQ